MFGVGGFGGTIGVVEVGRLPPGGGVGVDTGPDVEGPATGLISRGASVGAATGAPFCALFFAASLCFSFFSIT